MRNLVLLLSTFAILTSCEYTINNEMEDMNFYIDGTTIGTGDINVGTDGEIGVGNTTVPGADENGDPIDYTFNAPTGFVDGLVAYYPFSEGSVDDFSGNNNHGVNDGAESSENRFGEADSAMYFANTGTSGNTLITVGDLDTSSISEGLTITLWVKIDGEGFNVPRIVDFGNYNEMGGLSIQSPNGDTYTQTRYRIPANAYQRHVFHNKNGLWNQYAFSAHSNGQYRIYLNGQLDRMIQITQGELSLSDLLTIGASNDGNHAFRGWIDDISIHNRVLADSEIKEIYDLTE